LKNKYRMLAVISGAVVLGDQLTKMLVEKRLALHQSIEVIPGFFSLTHILNPGGAFGFLAGQSASVRRWSFSGQPLAPLD
jgi:Lipoprotein signal peptidase